MKNGKAENTKADIGKRIKDIRKDRPQMDLAKLAFKNSSSENSAQLKWSKIENGKQDATVEEIFDIASVLEVRPEKIIEIPGISDLNHRFANSDVLCYPKDHEAEHELLERILIEGDEDDKMAIKTSLSERWRIMDGNRELRLIRQALERNEKRVQELLELRKPLKQKKRKQEDEEERLPNTDLTEADLQYIREHNLE